MQDRAAAARGPFSLVTIAASAGGLTALATVLGGLPRDFSLPIAVVQHLDPNHKSMMADILGRRTALRVKTACGGERPEAGVVYIAPPATHMVIAPDGVIDLATDEPVHHLRPAADRLFQSAASVCGPTIGVVLTGTGADGAEGVIAIKGAGGIAIVQDEGSSAFFGMPHAAIETGMVDFILPLERIAGQLIESAGPPHE